MGAMKSKPVLDSKGMAPLFEWTARVHINKYDMDGEGFNILIFVGEVPEDPKEWRRSPSYVGSHSVLRGRLPSDGDKKDEKWVTEGFIQLNTALAKQPDLKSFEPDDVTPFLKENLHWRVQKSDRSAVPVESLPSLEVVALATPMKVEEDSLRPKPAGDAVHYQEVTAGRAGGYNEA